MTDIIKKVMLEEEYKDGTTMWRIPCDCHEPQHDARFWFEVDEHGLMSLSITTEVGFYKTSWRRNIWRRVKASFLMLFRGYYTMEGEVILKKDAIKGLQYALTEGSKRAEVAEDAFHAKARAEQAQRKSTARPKPSPGVTI